MDSDSSGSDSDEENGKLQSESSPVCQADLSLRSSQVPAEECLVSCHEHQSGQFQAVEPLASDGHKQLLTGGTAGPPDVRLQLVDQDSSVCVAAGTDVCSELPKHRTLDSDKERDSDSESESESHSETGSDSSVSPDLQETQQLTLLDQTRVDRTFAHSESASAKSTTTTATHLHGDQATVRQLVKMSVAKQQKQRLRHTRPKKESRRRAGGSAAGGRRNKKTSRNAVNHFDDYF